MHFVLKFYLGENSSRPSERRAEEAKRDERFFDGGCGGEEFKNSKYDLEIFYDSPFGCWN